MQMYHLLAQTASCMLEPDCLVPPLFVLTFLQGLRSCELTANFLLYDGSSNKFNVSLRALVCDACYTRC